MYKGLANSSISITTGGVTSATMQSMDNAPTMSEQNDIVQTVGEGEALAPDVHVTYVDRPMTDLQSALARPVRLFAYDGLSIVHSDGWDVLRLWFSDANVTKRLSNYHGIRGTIKVRIEFSVSSMVSGSQIWAINRVPSLPLTDPTTAGQFYAANGYEANITVGRIGKWLPGTLYQRPIKVIMTPSSPNVAELTVPYADNLKHYLKSSTVMSPVHLSTAALSPFYKMDGSAFTASSVPKFTVSLYFEQAEVFMYSVNQSNLENPYRAVSGVVGKASDFAKKIGFTTTAVDFAKKAGDTLASALGYSKPEIPINLAMENRVFTQMVSFNGVSAPYDLSDDMRDGFPIVSPVQCEGSDVDETDIAYLGAIPGIVSYNQTWSHLISFGGVLWSAAVGAEPFPATGTTTPYQATPGDYMIIPFRYYGFDSVKYTFTFDVNQYYKGFVQVFYDPVSATAPAVGGNAGTLVNSTLMSKIVEISGPTSFEFEIPFSQRTDMLRNTYAGPGYARTTNGVVYLCVQSRLSCGFNETPTAKFWVTKSYTGLRVEDYRPDRMLGMTSVPPYGKAAALVENQADPFIVDFGQRITNLNQILKVAAPDFMKLAVVDPVATTYTMFYKVRVPTLPFAFGPTTAGAYFPSAVAQTHPLVYFSSAFLAKTGTVKLYVSMPTSYGFAADCDVWTSKAEIAQPDCSLTPTNPFNSAFSNRMRETFKTSDGFGAEICLKMQNQRFCGGSYWPNPVAANNTGINTIEIGGSFPRTSLTRNPNVVRVDYAAGESYKLSCFNGVPPLWTYAVDSFSAGPAWPNRPSGLVTGGTDLPEFLTHEEDNSEPCDGDHPALEEGTLLVERKD